MSVTSGGTQAHGISTAPSIGTDGRYIAFQSTATDLIVVDTNGATDIFLRDTQTPTTILVSVALDGTQANGISTAPALSADGRYVVFISSATNLVPGISINSPFQIYRKDTVTGEVRIISTDNTGLITANGNCSSPRISDNGRYIVFDSLATNLDTNVSSGGIRQVYLKDMQTGAMTLLSQADATNGGDGASSNPDISADGSYIAFQSAATNLIVGDGNGATDDIFLHDTQTPITTTRVSVATGGGEANGASTAPSLSADGRYIVFESEATNLLGVGVDTNGVSDVYRAHSSHQ